MNKNIKNKINILSLIIAALCLLLSNSVYAFLSKADDELNLDTMKSGNVYFVHNSLSSLAKFNDQISSRNLSDIIRKKFSNLNPIRKTSNDNTSNHGYELGLREFLFPGYFNQGMIPVKIGKSIDRLSRLSNEFFLEKMLDIPTALGISYKVVMSKAPDSVTIKANASDGGKIDPSDAVRVEVGSNQKFTITPDEGYHLDGVYVDDIYVDSTTTYTFVNVTVDHTIHAAFVINQYTITSSTGANGTISPLGVVNVNYGGNQQFIISPDIGYHVDSVIVNGVKVDSTTSYTFNNVTTNNTIRSVFAINQYTITSSAGANGTITPSGNVSVSYGSNQTFNFSPNTGYHVFDVLVNSVSVGRPASYTFTNVTTNHTISVIFAADIPVTNLKILLQGIYLSGMMQSTLQSLLPLTQPYNSLPWNYGGTESVVTMPDSIVDWVLIELRTGLGLSTKVATRAALLKQNGLIMDTDGETMVKFPGVPIGYYYVVIRHRNHLAVMSATNLILTTTSDLYDFTTGTTKYFGNDAKLLSVGKYGMYAGDYSGDGYIDGSDYIGPDNDRYQNGYLRSDLNMDGYIDGSDFVNPDNNRYTSTNVPE